MCPINFIWHWYIMTGRHSVNIKLSNSQLDKLKPAVKNMTGIALRLSSDMIGADKNNFVHNFLLTNTGRAPVFVRLFANSTSTYKNYQRSKIIQSGGFLDRLLGKLMKVALPLVKNKLVLLARSSNRLSSWCRNSSY